MFRFIKRQFCQHAWHKVWEGKTESISCVGSVIDIDVHEKVILFCPKCYSRKAVSPKEWKLMCKEYEIVNTWDNVKDESV